MKAIHIFAFLLLPFAVSFCISPNIGDDSSKTNIAFSPDSLIFAQGGGSATFFVTSSAPGIALYSDQDWVSSIEPPYEAQYQGNFTVTVKANPAASDRTGSVIVKVGQTGASIPIRQEGMDHAGSDIAVPDGYTLVWHDEFDYEGLPDPTLWKYQTGDGGWGNNELQDYVSGSYNGENIADVSDGTLKIHAKKIDGKVRSVRMNSRPGWTYGYIEASIKLPSGRGTWPAFWMMPSNYTAWPRDGEIDIMEEVGYNANYCSSTIHCTAYNNGGTAIEHAERYVSGAQTSFHTYAMEWTAQKMTFYQDGKSILTYNNNGEGYSYWPFDNPFYIILNLAWGGSWGGARGVDESCLPATMEIDYVRVYQRK